MANTEKKSNQNNRGVGPHPSVVSSLQSGKRVTMTRELTYQSDLTATFLNQNYNRIIQVFERLAAILRMAKDDAAAYKKITQWHDNVNLAIANEQLETIEEQLRQITIKTPSEEELELNVPDAYKIKFEVTHPVTIGILNTFASIDSVAANIQRALFEMRIDDLQHDSAQRQTLKVLHGILDRIGKITAPGKREGGRFSTSYYVKLLKDPTFDLVALTDMPYEIRQTLGLVEVKETPASDQPTINAEPASTESTAKPAAKKRAAKKTSTKKTEVAA